MDNYIRLQSSEPITDCGRKYNWLYIVSLVVVTILFLIVLDGDFPAILFMGVIMGLVLGWLIKNLICRSVVLKLRKKKFALDNRIPYPELITKLNQTLTPMGMHIETQSNGNPSATYKGIIYDIFYDDTQNFFTIWWRVNFARAFLKVDEIGLYRKTSVAMGIIGYYVQQICSDIPKTTYETSYSNQSNIGNNSEYSMQDIKYCSKCGNPYKIGTRFCSKCGNSLV